MTSFAIAGESPGQKLSDAKSSQIPILSFLEFIALYAKGQYYAADQHNPSREQEAAAVLGVASVGPGDKASGPPANAPVS